LAGYFQLFWVFQVTDVFAFRTKSLFLTLINQSLFNNQLEFLKQTNFDIILNNLLLQQKFAMWTGQIFHPILSDIDSQIHLKTVQTDLVPHPIYVQNLLFFKLAVTNHTGGNFILSEEITQENGDICRGDEVQNQVD
jgi:hypothetical protein